ncbi:hypothetical protein U1Q18_043402 [Sarracenia purpurea var. burkii]
MPHRTTYFFPRQFPDRGFDSSSKVFQDHEKKIAKEDFNGDSDGKASKISKELTVGGKHATVSDRFTGDKIRGKQLAAFVDWLADKKVHRLGHVKVRLDDGDEDHELDLFLPPVPPEKEDAVTGKDRNSNRAAALQRMSSGICYGSPPVVTREGGGGGGKERGLDPYASLQRWSSVSSYGGATEALTGGKDRGFDRMTSLKRLSSGSSYAGSLFSGTTLDGNLSSGFKDSQDSTTREEEAEGKEEEGRENLAQRTRESYYLQLMLAKRLAEHASIASEPLFPQECRLEGPGVSPDVETVSYRLWNYDTHAKTKCA